MIQQLNDEERLDWLQLIRTPSIGPITFHQLIAKFGSAKDALAALPELSRNTKRASKKPASRDLCEEELARAEKSGARLIAACEEDYPLPLRATPGFPPLIYVKGSASLFEKTGIAIIGARNASAVGRKMARTLAEDLGEAGIVVVSGLARGIDGAAHEAALGHGTIAVVAGGVDVIYPPEHEELTARIAHEGAIISECAMGARPTARDFPKRNRIISGLSRGVVVVEAAERSGTLITARFALEQGREVFAVPGSPLDPRCQGANKLIRDGAILVQNANDILSALSSQLREPGEEDAPLFDWNTENESETVFDKTIRESTKQKILSLLSYTPIHKDELLRELEVPPGLAADALLELVLAGDIDEHPGAAFSLGSNS